MQLRQGRVRTVTDLLKPEVRNWLDGAFSQSVPCRRCGAKPGERCRSRNGTPRGNALHVRSHKERKHDADAAYLQFIYLGKALP